MHNIPIFTIHFCCRALVVSNRLNLKEKCLGKKNHWKKKTLKRKEKNPWGKPQAKEEPWPKWPNTHQCTIPKILFWTKPNPRTLSIKVRFCFFSPTPLTQIVNSNLCLSYLSPPSYLTNLFTLTYPCFLLVLFFVFCLAFFFSFWKLVFVFSFLFFWEFVLLLVLFFSWKIIFLLFFSSSWNLVFKKISMFIFSFLF